MSLKYVWVTDRTPRATRCAWCSMRFAPQGYISCCSTALAYCTPECWATHERLSQSFLKSYHAHHALLEDKRHEATV